MRRLAFWIILPVCAAATTLHGLGQSSTAVPQGAAPEVPSNSAPMPRDYRGVQTHVDGIWVTPIANAPFMATVEIVSQEKLPDGSEHTVKTVNHIARSSSGRIRNERRRMVPASFTGEPMLLEAHLYDPNTRENIFFAPATRIARESVLRAAPRMPAQALPPDRQITPPDVTITDLGEKPLNGVALHGTRKVRTIAADRSGTGKPVTVTDEYWYAPELAVYLVIRHNDPRTGEQLVAVTDVQRAEPPADLMQVPDGYKLVDETPPPR